MAQHSRYWCNSSIADWLRGTKKPMAATSEDWNKWYADAEAAHPVRYWLVEEGFGKFQDFVTIPARKLRDIRNYFTNRYVSAIHVLPTGLEKGQWHEFETRLLHGMFGGLVDFIEVEQAWQHVMWNDDTAKDFTPIRRGIWRQWRCKEAGLARLKWERELTMDEDMGVEKEDERFGKPTSQAVGAQELFDLYTWWTVTRPARTDPLDASGWTAFHDAQNANIKPEDINTKSKRRARRWNRSSENREESSRLYGIANKIEKEYEEEDEQMMHRLVKIRRSMWS